MVGQINKSGGARKGSGRPKGEPTETVSFRVHKDSLEKAREKHGRKLNGKVNAFIKRIGKL